MSASHARPTRVDVQAAPLRLLCIGHSHLRCVRSAADAAHDWLVAQDVTVDVLVLNHPSYEPHFTPAGADGGAAALNPQLQAELLARGARADAVFASIGGNAHSAFGLAEHPRPYDFVSEAEPGAALIAGREQIPGALVRAALMATDLMQHQSALRRFLPGLLQRPLVHLESPPPPRDAAHLLLHPGFYRDVIAQRGVAPAPLRRKLWRLHAHLVAADCAAAGIEWAGVPHGCITDDGYLQPAALAADPTHANDWYGRRLIEQMVRRTRPGFVFSEPAAAAGRPAPAAPAMAVA